MIAPGRTEIVAAAATAVLALGLAGGVALAPLVSPTPPAALQPAGIHALDDWRGADTGPGRA